MFVLCQSAAIIITDMLDSYPVVFNQREAGIGAA